MPARSSDQEQLESMIWTKHRRLPYAEQRSFDRPNLVLNEWFKVVEALLAVEAVMDG